MFCFLEYFRHHPHIGLTYEPSRDGEHEGDDFIAMSDASWETRRSTSGWIVLMWQATVHWRSVQQPSIALSSCQSEIMAASEATKDVLSYRRLKAELESYVEMVGVNAEGRLTVNGIAENAQQLDDVA